MRDKILGYLSYQIVLLHGYLKKSTQPWQITVDALAPCTTGSLGQELLQFYTCNQFAPIPRMEYHDVDHLVLQYDSTPRGEMMLQWFVLGNGKKTFFAALAGIGSIIIIPEMLGKCLEAYNRGKSFPPIWHIDYRNELNTPLEELRKKMLIPINKFTNN